MSHVPQQIGKYDLLELLGRGGMAEVWKAFDTQLRRHVAIKLLHANLQSDPDFVSRFTHEAQTVAALRHPNIVQIYDFHISESEETGNTLAYMVMEYIKGQTLAHYIRNTSKQKKFPVATDIIRLFTPISLALDYAHRQGTIHRDIKPANILLDHNNRARNSMGEPLLSDFGLAKVLDAPSQTLAGVVFGTPLYISPEQVQNQPVSNRTDLYSLGIVLYEIFTASPPFQGGSSSSIMLQRVVDQPADPRTMNPDLSSAVSEVLLKGIARDPQERYSSASAMTAALAEACGLVVPEDLRQALEAELQKCDDEQAVDDAAATVVASSSLHNPATSSTSPPSEPSGSGSSAATIDLLSTEGEEAHSDALFPDSEGALTAEADVDAADEHLSVRETIPPNSLQHKLPEEDVSDATIAVPVQEDQEAASDARIVASAGEQSGAAIPPVAEPETAIPVLPRAAGGVQKHRGLKIAALVALIVILIGAATGIFFALASSPHKATTATIGPNTVVGHATFLSSLNMDQTSIQGNNDKLQIDLSSIPAPRHDDSYYAWLLPDKDQPEAAPILLGKLAVKNGQVHFVYSGDQTDSDLLGTTSRFLITEESSTITPDIPSPDLSAWRYYAEIPQTVPPGQQYSLLDHLRHLLANDPDLIALHITGGLDIWATRNTQKVSEWSTNAQHDWKTQDYSGLKQNVVSELAYLDGARLVEQDVPPGTTFHVNQVYAQVGLLELEPGQQEPPSYLYHIALHLNGVLASPGSTSYQRSIATEINTGLENIKVELGQVRQDAIKLAHMNDAQLAQPSTETLLNDMQAQASLAYQGQIDPHTQKVTKIGMTQIYRDNQQLATFEIKPYHS